MLFSPLLLFLHYQIVIAMIRHKLLGKFEKILYIGFRATLTSIYRSSIDRFFFQTLPEVAPYHAY